MAPNIESDLVIEADIEQVWALTMDVERWPELTPTITSVERLDDGPMRIGSTARIVQPKQRPATWTVTELEAPHSFAWQTRVFGITMVGRHQLVPLGPGRCRNELSIELSGFGSGLLGRVLGATLRSTIETENVGFKREAERLAAAAAGRPAPA